MSTSGGAILCQQAYAQGKMIQSSAWSDILPRGITPSDVDLVFDSRGRVLLVEMSRRKDRWDDLDVGQKVMYKNLVKAGRGDTIAAIARHSVDGRAICSATDVDSFQVMFLRQQEKFPSVTPVLSGSRWVNFVRQWVQDPIGTLRFLQLPGFA